MKTDIELTRVVIVGNTKKEITSALTPKMYGWSKWGGSNFGLVQKNKTFSWYCQACREQLGASCPSYMFEMAPNEFIRICSNCQRLTLLKHIDSLTDLINQVRSHREIWD